MLADQGFIDHCLELLAPLGRPRARRMFGGHGLYLDEHFIALVIADVLYLKADAQAQPAFAEAGCQPFTYTAAGDRRAVMAYWSAPDEAMESPAAMQPWARLALASALRAAADKRAAAPRKPRASSRSAQAGRVPGQAEGAAPAAPPPRARRKG